jgi:hypothetical protein
MVPSASINLVPDLALTGDPDGSLSSRVFHEEQRTKDDRVRSSDATSLARPSSFRIRPSSIVIPRGEDDDRRMKGAGGRREMRS